MTDVLSTLLVIPLVYGLFVVMRGVWRLFTGGSPAGGGGSSAEAPPWTPYQSPGAPMPPAGGFVTGYVVGHWLGEHHHDHGMATGMGMGAGVAGGDDDFGDAFGNDDLDGFDGFDDDD